MDWAVYTPDFLDDLQNIFLGLSEKHSQPEVREISLEFSFLKMPLSAV